MLEWFVLKPLNALEEQRIGCTAQCPFCGAVCAGGVGCQIEGSSNQKHRAEIHMPQVLRDPNVSYFTKIYVWSHDANMATFFVITHPVTILVTDFTNPENNKAKHSICCMWV